jgi:phage tail-like protein
MADLGPDRARADSYWDFRFRVWWDGRHVAGFAKFTPRRPPRRARYEAVTLERGITHDREFEQWATKVWPAEPRKAWLRDMRIDVHDEVGRLTTAYKVLHAWVSESQALPELDANANAVAIQHLKLEHEGFEREDGVPEPDEPSPTSCKPAPVRR